MQLVVENSTLHGYGKSLIIKDVVTGSWTVPIKVINTKPQKLNIKCFVFASIFSWFMYENNEEVFYTMSGFKEVKKLYNKFISVQKKDSAKK